MMRDDKDFRIEWFSGTGKGGQHKNKHSNAARIIHVPTGIKQEQQGRKRETNKREAMRLLLIKLNEQNSVYGHKILSNIMKEQKGSGMRGDKIRTIRFQDDIVINHKNNKRMSTKKYMKGDIDLLWK